MGLMVDTIIKWYNPNDDDEEGEPVEGCRDGQCVGIITKMGESSIDRKPVATVKWWQLCALHAEIDHSGTGPYGLDYLWQIGKLY